MCLWLKAKNIYSVLLIFYKGENYVNCMIKI